MIVGIDNGLNGGIVKLNLDSVQKFVMPIIAGEKREYDISKIAELLTGADHVFIERAQAMPAQGVSSMFSIGKGFGIMLGVCAALKLRHEIVGPKTWQKEMFRDLPKADTKQMSFLVCQRLWPKEDWRATDRCKNPHDGLTDAALIAEFGRRTLCRA